jgi:hypothetical protein
MTAGERPLAIVLSGHTVLDLKARGAPIDQVILDPYFAQAKTADRAPRAHTPRRCSSTGRCRRKAKA